MRVCDLCDSTIISEKEADFKVDFEWAISLCSNGYILISPNPVDLCFGCRSELKAMICDYVIDKAKKKEDK